MATRRASANLTNTAVVDVGQPFQIHSEAVSTGKSFEGKLLLQQFCSVDLSLLYFYLCDYWKSNTYIR